MLFRSIKGLCARGGAVVDLVWKEGKLVEAIITAKHKLETRVVYNEMEWSIELEPGGKVSLK